MSGVLIIHSLTRLYHGYLCFETLYPPEGVGRVLVSAVMNKAAHTGTLRVNGGAGCGIRGQLTGAGLRVTHILVAGT